MDSAHTAGLPNTRNNNEAKYYLQSTKYKIQNTKYKIQNIKVIDGLSSYCRLAKHQT